MPYLFVACTHARSLCVHPNFQATTRATKLSFVTRTRCRSLCVHTLKNNSKDWFPMFRCSISRTLLLKKWIIVNDHLISGKYYASITDLMKFILLLKNPLRYSCIWVAPTSKVLILNRKRSSKKFLWSPRIWDGRWWEPIKGYVSKIYGKKNLWLKLFKEKGLSWD